VHCEWVDADDFYAARARHWAGHEHILDSLAQTKRESHGEFFSKRRLRENFTACIQQLNSYSEPPSPVAFDCCAAISPNMSYLPKIPESARGVRSCGWRIAVGFNLLILCSMTILGLAVGGRESGDNASHICGLLLAVISAFFAWILFWLWMSSVDCGTVLIEFQALKFLQLTTIHIVHNEGRHRILIEYH
jgi:hypothetical protein